MPIPSPFHERTAKLCTSFRWKDWSGYAAVCSYDTTHDREYFAFRESAGLLDVSPLFKYEVYGPDAVALLSRMMVRDVSVMASMRCNTRRATKNPPARPRMITSAIDHCPAARMIS